MDQGFRATVPESEVITQFGVAWAAIAAGAVAAAALTLVLVAFGAGWGFPQFPPGAIVECLHQHLRSAPASIFALLP